MASALTFNARLHAYKLNGKPIPGVTTLLNKGLPKPALPYWSAKAVATYVAENLESVEQLLASAGEGPTIAMLKGIPWQKRDEAAIRGTDIHALAERLVHGEPVDVPEHLHGYVQGHAEWMDRFHVKPERVETLCYSRRNHYAGTYDFRGWIEGRHCTGDWKSSKGVYGSHGLQVAAYDHAEFQVVDGTDQPQEPTGNLAVIHIQDGVTEHYWVNDPDAIYKRFLHVAYLARSIDLIEGCLGEPVGHPDTQGDAA